jgi:hypothetical protein
MSHRPGAAPQLQEGLSTSPLGPFCHTEWGARYHALTFERLAAEEDNEELKTELSALARAYRKLVAERAKQFGLPPPSAPL